MKGRVGRPKSENALQNRVVIRLNDYEMKMLDELCDSLQLSKSEIMRMALYLVAKEYR